MKNFTKAFLLFFILFLQDLQSQTIIDAESIANQYQGKAGTPAFGTIRYNPKRNIRIDAEDVIHVFLWDDGNTLLSGFPTTMTQRDKIQVHLLKPTTNTDIFQLEIQGSYEPTLVVVGGKVVTAATKGGTIEIMDFAVHGPYTGSITIKLKSRKTKDDDYKELISSTQKISPTINASIGTGFIYSTLRNPTNIREVPLAGGGNTLNADNINGNATLAVMATLYPWGRNSLMLRSSSLKDRMGVVVGTYIASSSKNFKNLLLGAQYDFAVGGSIVAGVDIAERQLIRGVDYDNFEFGKTVYTGSITNDLYKEVGVGFFVGLQVDTRIFSKMFGE